MPVTTRSNRSAAQDQVLNNVIVDQQEADAERRAGNGEPIIPHYLIVRRHPPTKYQQTDDEEVVHLDRNFRESRGLPGMAIGTLSMLDQELRELGFMPAGITYVRSIKGTESKHDSTASTCMSELQIAQLDKLLHSRFWVAFQRTRSIQNQPPSFCRYIARRLQQPETVKIIVGSFCVSSVILAFTFGRVWLALNP